MIKKDAVQEVKTVAKPTKVPTAKRNDTPVVKEEQKPVTPRSGQYQVYAIATDDKSTADNIASQLARINKHTVVEQDGKVFRVKFGNTTTSRKIVQDRLDILIRMGLRTANFLLS